MREKKPVWLAVPATTPLLLARYVRVRSGDSLPMHLRAAAALFGPSA